MMKHLQKPAVQMLLLLAVIGIAGGVFYFTRQRGIVSANKAAPTAVGAKPAAATSTIVAEERKVDLADKRVAQIGGSQVQQLVVQKRKPPAPTIISTGPAANSKPPKPPPFPKLVHITNTAPEPYKDEEPKLFAPRGLLIKAALVLTVDSSSLETPVLALVTEDVYWNQKLIVPAGTQVQATLNLCDFYIVATSNIGADALMELRNSPMATVERFIEDLAAAELRPEVLARFNVRCVFQKLGFNAQKKIAEIMLGKELKNLASKGYHLTAGTGVLELLVSQGVEPRLGVRRMRATAETACRHAVREALLAGKPTSGTLIAENGHLVIHS
jgi:hypothetical protein